MKNMIELKKLNDELYDKNKNMTNKGFNKLVNYFKDDVVVEGFSREEIEESVVELVNAGCLSDMFEDDYKDFINNVNNDCSDALIDS